jgi:hypothetical protein
LERMERPGLAYWSSRLPLAGRTKRKGMPQLGFGGWKIERVCLLCLVALTEEGCSCQRNKLIAVHFAGMNK